MDGLLRIRGQVRVGLWLSLLLLTLTLLLFPTRLTLEYHAVQSITSIPDLPLFAALYAVWLLSLVLLLLSGREAPRWEQPALVGIFALVFIAFWLVSGPYTGLRYDGLGNAASVRYLTEQGEGRLPVDHPNLGYYSFPGMHLLALALVQVTGLGLSQGVTLALAFHVVLLAVLLYIFLLRTLNSPSVAALGTLLAIQGNIMLARYSFYPGIWALVFLVMFLILLHRPGRALFDTWQDRFLMLLLLGAATITHPVTAVLLFSLLAGIYLVRNLHLFRTGATVGLVRVATLAVFLVIPISWDIYWATRAFETIARVTSAVIEDFTEEGLLVHLFNLSEGYAGAEVPLWTVMVRAFWWGALFVFGVILGLGNLSKIRGLSRTQQIETGGLVGIITLSVVVTVLSPGGGQFYRFLLYGAFFIVPIILRFLLSLPGKRRRVALGLAMALFFVLSLPTFMAHNNLVGVSNYYPSELQAGRFLRETSAGQDERLTIFSDPAESGVLSFSVPDARFITTPEAPVLKGEKDFWQAANKAADDFRAFGTGTGRSEASFYLSQRRIAVAELFFGIQPQDPGWEELQDRLLETNKVYDNGAVQAYETTGNMP